MKKVIGLAALVLALGTTMAFDVEAKRLGGAKSSGMQRQQTTQPATTPGSPAQAAPAAGTAAAAAAPAAAAAATKRSWMGPIAGLAAGIGLMALASHLGFGEAMANFMLFALLGVVVLAVVGFVMRNRMARNATPVAAGAGAGTGGQAGGSFGGGFGSQPAGGTRIGSALGGITAAAAQPSAIPADFDAAGFARNATQQFLALQSANDARDLQRLRDYLTPQMFEEIRADVESRGDVAQHTQVFGLTAQVLEVAEEGDRYIVSVRFTGGIRDQVHADTEDLDEVWHLTKPRTGFGGWVVAGIQQVTPAA